VKGGATGAWAAVDVRTGLLHKYVTLLLLKGGPIKGGVLSSLWEQLTYPNFYLLEYQWPGSIAEIYHVNAFTIQIRV